MEVGEIYIGFNRSLLAFIKSKVRHKEDAEDILHDVFLKITLNIHQLSSKDKLQNWLFKITRNAIIDYYRSHSGKTSELLETDLISEAAFDRPEEAVRELEECVKPFITQLPEKYRQIILESEINGARQKDLSAKYNLAYPSLKSRVQRGREKLKDLFIGCCKIDIDSRGGIMGVTSRGECNEDDCKKC